MAKTKRPDKVQFNVVKPPPGLIFFEDLCIRRSFYGDKLQEALRSDCLVEVLETDKYAVIQFRMAAKKLRLRLAFARSNGRIYMKPLQNGEHQNRLALLLRNVRTPEELASVQPALELDLKSTLKEWERRGQVAHDHSRNSWRLTAKGEKELL